VAISPLPIFAYYNKQRFTQFGSGDCANWYGIAAPDTKKAQALYPAMGRKHVTFFNENRLIFDEEPSQEFKSINYAYFIVGTLVYAMDRFYNLTLLGNIPLGRKTWFAFLPLGNVVYAILTAETESYLITESGGVVTMQLITDPNRPLRPVYVAAFGDRFAVSEADSPNFRLTAINVTQLSNPGATFTVNGAPLVLRASGVIGQMGVFHNQLYIFNQYTTDVWAEIPSQLTVAGTTTTLPWKKNTSYNFDYGIADPFTLSIDFDRMVFLANNRSGLVSFMVSNGGQPQDISSQAINVLLENSLQDTELESPFLNGMSDGFLYQWENTIFYRVSAGPYLNFGEIDREDNADAIEYNFGTGTWARVIELNGERNRIRKHVYFNNKHLVTVAGDPAVYEMAGNIYYNELRRTATAPQAANAFIKYPMRYELTTQQIYLEDYAEFLTNYIEIDFVFGNKTFYKSNAPFDNTVFIIDETPAPSGDPLYMISESSTPGNPIFIVTEVGNTPEFDDNHYNSLFKPHIELYVSDDGGETFYPADLREFSPLGEYRWRMRWYQLGCSRNRCYKLVCVSSAPIVILGACQDTERVSGGAN
jgi:hypothetical protein